MSEQDLLEQLHRYGSIFEGAVASAAEADSAVATLDDRLPSEPWWRRKTWLVGCAAAALLIVLGLTAFAVNERPTETVTADRGGARPCLPADFGWASSGVLPPGVAGTAATTPPLSYSSLQHALIEAMPCAFTGLEILNGDPMSIAVHVAPLGEVETTAIARVGSAFPNYKLVGVQARQSFAEADAQMGAISAVLHRDSTAGMGIDGQVTVDVYGVANDDIPVVQAAIIAASQDVPAGKNAVPPIVNVTSEPSAFSQ